MLKLNVLLKEKNVRFSLIRIKSRIIDLVQNKFLFSGKNISFYAFYEIKVGTKFY